MLISKESFHFSYRDPTAAAAVKCFVYFIKMERQRQKRFKSIEIGKLIQHYASPNFLFCNTTTPVFAFFSQSNLLENVNDSFGFCLSGGPRHPLYLLIKIYLRYLELNPQGIISSVRHKAWTSPNWACRGGFVQNLMNKISWKTNLLIGIVMGK